MVSLGGFSMRWSGRYKIGLVRQFIKPQAQGHTASNDIVSCPKLSKIDALVRNTVSCVVSLEGSEWWHSRDPRFLQVTSKCGSKEMPDFHVRIAMPPCYQTCMHLWGFFCNRRHCQELEETATRGMGSWLPPSASMILQRLRALVLNKPQSKKFDTCPKNNGPCKVHGYLYYQLIPRAGRKWGHSLREADNSANLSCGWVLSRQ